MGELSYLLGMIAVMMFATVSTRALPFVLLRGREHHPLLEYLGRFLPPAVMTVLVIYALRHVSLEAAPHGFPELASVGLTVLAHLWVRNALLSIGAGTGAYMYLVQSEILLQVFP